LEVYPGNDSITVAISTLDDAINATLN